MSQTLSVRLPDELYEIIRERARFNRRSAGSELLFLVETALSLKAESSREMVHLLTQLSDTMSLPAAVTSD